MNSLAAENWIDCKLCNKYNIHKNDYQKHCSSRRHKGKVMKQAILSGDADTQMECTICKKNFLNQEYFDIHLRGKVHKKAKRKYMKVLGAVQLEGTDIHRIMTRSLTRNAKADIPVVDNSKFRQKYKDRNITSDEEYSIQLQNYTKTIIAYLSIKLALDQNIQDFFISINDKEWQSFGDIVIHVCYKDKNVIYAIKCKQITNHLKRIQTLKDAKIIMDKEYRSILGLKSTFHCAKFAIFTACTASSKLTNSEVTLSASTLNSFRLGHQEITEDGILLTKPLTKKNEIINTTMDCENIFTFYLNHHSKNIMLPNLSLYTHQVDNLEIIRKLLEKRYDLNPNISSDYLRYIDNWSYGKLGGNFKLQKRDVILTLSELLLVQYVVKPKMINLMHDSFEIWNSVTDKVDLTIIGTKSMITSKMCQPINQMIEDIFNVKIDTISRTISLKDRLSLVTDPKIKAYLFEEVDNIEEDIPLYVIYRVLWKTGLAPLLLSCENDEGSKDLILDIIALMKEHGVSKKFILITAEPDAVKTKAKLKMFRNLEDIREFVDMNDIHIRVTENFQLSLETVQSTDRFVFKWITPDIFFDLALNKYSFKQSYFNKTDEQVELKIVLDSSVINEVENCLYGGYSVDRMTKRKELHGIDPTLF